MRIDDLLRDGPPDPWGGTTRVADTELLTALQKGADARHTDLEVALALAKLLRADFERYGTSFVGLVLDDESSELAVRALKAVLRRLDITLDLPFRNFSTWTTYWVKMGATGSGAYQARRDLLEPLFEPVIQDLIEREDATFIQSLADPISPRSATGWAAVDDEIREMRRHFEVARSPQDYRAVGNASVGVLEALSRTVYDVDKHLREGEQEPAPDKTKQRLSRYVEDAVPDSTNAELRALVTKTIEFAQRVKHDHTPTRTEAGITADAVIMLANILRRLAEP